MIYFEAGEYLTERFYELDLEELNKKFEQAIAAYEGVAFRFSVDVIKDAKVRENYAKDIKRGSEKIRELVVTKKISVKDAARHCHEMRNFIMDESRKITSPQGLAFAEKYKPHPHPQEFYLNKYSQRIYKIDFKDLNAEQKRIIQYATVESATRDNIKFSTENKILKALGKVTLVVTATIAAYEIYYAANRPKEAIKQGVQISGGALGGAAAGLAVSPLCGPAAPFCAVALVLIGSVLGGISSHWLVDTLDEEIEEFLKWTIQ